MAQSKYSIADYWRNKINNNENFWSGLFENQKITPQSIILNPVILNSYSNQMEDAWSVYPNVYSVLGFLKLIYLPTSFFGLIEEEVEYQYYFEESLEDFLEGYEDKYPHKKELVYKMEKFNYDLNKLWKYDEDACLEKLRSWTMEFNKNWEDKSGVSLSVNVFSSPKETADFIIEGYEEDLGITFLEDDIGLTKDEFINLANDDIYTNDFLNRKFTNILTNRLKVSF